MTSHLTLSSLAPRDDKSLNGCQLKSGANQILFGSIGCVLESQEGRSVKTALRSRRMRAINNQSFARPAILDHVNNVIQVAYRMLMAAVAKCQIHQSFNLCTVTSPPCYIWYKAYRRAVGMLYIIRMYLIRITKITTMCIYSSV